MTRRALLVRRGAERRGEREGRGEEEEEGRKRKMKVKRNRRSQQMVGRVPGIRYSMGKR